MDGVIRRVDDPYWATHSPPNGYRCRCSLTTLSEAEAQARSGIGRGLHKTPTLPDGRPAEPDKGWDYNPYQDRLAGVRKAVLDRRSQCGGLFSAAHLAGKKRHNTPMWCDEKNYAGILLRSLQGYAFADGKMPEPRKPQGVEKLSSILSEHNLFARFMREFGDDDSVEFTDVIGNRLLIDKSLFEDINGNWKIMKGERAPWLLYTAINIKKPDEIWLERGRQGGNDRLYYLSQFDIGMKGLMSCLAVFDRKQEHAGLWGGRTNYATTQFGYMIRKRDKEIKGEIKYWRWE